MLDTQFSKVYDELDATQKIEDLEEQLIVIEGIWNRVMEVRSKYLMNDMQYNILLRSVTTAYFFTKELLATKSK
jgi:hypothetical protein